MTKSGFDIDELERSLARSEAEPEDLEDEGFWTEARVIAAFPAILTEIRELRAENARLKEGMATIRARKWNTLKEGCDAASEAARIARAALGEPQWPMKIFTRR